MRWFYFFKTKFWRHVWKNFHYRYGLCLSRENILGITTISKTSALLLLFLLFILLSSICSFSVWICYRKLNYTRENLWLSLFLLTFCVKNRENHKRKDKKDNKLACQSHLLTWCLFLLYKHPIMFNLICVGEALPQESCKEKNVA